MTAVVEPSAPTVPGHDPRARTLTLATWSALVPAIADVLLAAWPDGPPVLQDVTPSAVDGRWQATATIGDDAVLLEAETRDGAIASMLLLMPRPAQGWSPADAVAGLPADAAVQGLQLRWAVTVVSFGLDRVEGPRTLDGRQVDLDRYDLADGVTHVSDDVRELGGLSRLPLWADESIPGALVPDQGQLVTVAVVRTDARRGSVTVELWWDDVDGRELPDGLGGAHQVGIGVTHDGPDADQAFWLLGLRSTGCRVLLEALPAPGSPLRYRTRVGTRIELGEAASALTTLVGIGSGALSSLVPRTLSLLALTWEPERHLDLVVAAGVASTGEALTGFGPVELRDVTCDLACDLGTTDRAVELGVTATVFLFGIEWRVTARPGDRLEGGLADPDGIALGALVEGALAVDLPFALDTLVLRDAWLTRTLDDAAVTLGPGNAVTLEEIRLDAEHAEHTEGAATTVALGATFGLGRVTAAVEASRTEDGGWVLDGLATAPGGLSLTDLAEDLAAAFGVVVPSGLPDVHVDQLGLTYETSGGGLELRAVVGWDVAADVPVLSGTHSVLMTLTLARPDDGGPRAAILAVDWTVEKTIGADRHQLEASAWIARERQVFTVDYQAPAEPLTFSDVAAGLGLATVVPATVTGAMDVVLQISTLSLSYTRPGNEVALAWTRPWEHGTILVEASRTTGSAQLDVTWSGDSADTTVGLAAVVDLVGPGPDVVPDALADLLAVGELGFRLTDEAGAGSMLVHARSPHGAIEQAFVLVPRGQGASGAVVGLAFRPNGLEALASALPGDIGGLLAAARPYLQVEPTHLYVSTTDRRNFVPPSFAESVLLPSHRQDPSDTTPAPSTPFGTAVVPLSRGVAVGLRATVGAGGLISKILSPVELDAQIALSSDRLRLQAFIPGTLALDAGGGTRVELTDASVGCSVGEIVTELTVSGALVLKLFGQRTEISAYLGLSETGVQLHLPLTGLDLSPPALLRGVHIDATEAHPLWLSGGVEFEPPGFDLGVTASFHIQTATRRYEGSVTAVLEIVEAVPQPQYVDFEIDTLDLPGVLEALTGADSAVRALDDAAHDVAARTGGAGPTTQVAAWADSVRGAMAHVETVLSEVSLRSVRIRWCDSLLVLPDGTQATPGVSLRAGVSILGWHAVAMLDFASTPVPALTGHFEAEPLSIAGVIELWGDGAGVRVPTPGAAATTSPDATPAAGAATPAVVTGDDTWLVRPGGPVLHVSTGSSPFLHADLHARLFGFIAADVHAEVTDSGFAFDMHLAVGPVSGDLHCHLARADRSFDASGTISVHLDGTIGPLLPGVEATRLRLTTDLDAAVELRTWMTGDDIHVELVLHASFSFGGASYSVPTLTLTAPVVSVDDLVSAIWRHIEDLAHEIFSELIAPIGHLAAEAATEVAAVTVAGAQAVADVATKAAGEAAEIATSAVHAVEADVAAVAAEAAQIAGAADAAVRGAEEAAAAEVAALHDRAVALAATGAELLDAARARATTILHDGEAAVAALAHAAEELVDVAERWADARLSEATRWVSERLAHAEALVAQLATEVTAYVADIEHEIDALGAEIEEIGRELARAAREAEEALERAGHTAEHALESVGHTVARWFGGW